jgi:uncharacterized protein (DUF2141 family)
MKYFLLIFLLIFSKVQVMAKEFNVTLNGINPTRGGVVTVFIFDKSGFPKSHHKAIHTNTKNAEATSMTFSFDMNLEEFAIKAWHDEDENGKVSKNWTGIYPKEGLGFTNKQRVTTFGPPKYSKSKVTRIQTGDHINIDLIYPKGAK